MSLHQRSRSLKVFADINLPCSERHNNFEEISLLTLAPRTALETRLTSLIPEPSEGADPNLKIGLSGFFLHPAAELPGHAGLLRCSGCHNAWQLPLLYKYRAPRELALVTWHMEFVMSLKLSALWLSRRTSPELESPASWSCKRGLASLTKLEAGYILYESLLAVCRRYKG